VARKWWLYKFDLNITHAEVMITFDDKKGIQPTPASYRILWFAKDKDGNPVKKGIDINNGEY